MPTSWPARSPMPSRPSAPSKATTRTSWSPISTRSTPAAAPPSRRPTRPPRKRARSNRKGRREAPFLLAGLAQQRQQITARVGVGRRRYAAFSGLQFAQREIHLGLIGAVDLVAQGLLGL